MIHWWWKHRMPNRTISSMNWIDQVSWIFLFIFFLNFFIFSFWNYFRRFLFCKAFKGKLIMLCEDQSRVYVYMAASNCFLRILLNRNGLRYQFVEKYCKKSWLFQFSVRNATLKKSSLSADHQRNRVPVLRPKPSPYMGHCATTTTHKNLLIGLAFIILVHSFHSLVTYATTLTARNKTKTKKIATRKTFFAQSSKECVRANINIYEPHTFAQLHGQKNEKLYILRRLNFSHGIYGSWFI